MPCLGRGLLANPEGATEADLGEAYRAALLLVYRLLAILHAEGRGLLPVHDPAYQC